MSRLLNIALVLSALIALSGCRTIGAMFEGVNSDRQNGAGYAKVPRKDADGRMHVHEPDWVAGPERIY
ncbi:MAG: hypothetical protein WDZ48_08160 [Pirellulales bacterium]